MGGGSFATGEINVNVNNNNNGRGRRETYVFEFLCDKHLLLNHNNKKDNLIVLVLAVDIV